ncbi:MAG: hypothetical protein ACI8RA_002923 [Chlamydiales bacterium]|jgi:hypothetical protein
MNDKQKELMFQELPEQPDPKEVRAKEAARMKVLLLQQQVLKSKMIVRSLGLDN